MPTYQEYLEYAKSKGFLPVSEEVFKNVLRHGYNPITKEFS
jgi:hypothetical protein